MNDLDAIDRDILRLLQQDARSSNQKLAKQVGLSPSPCWRRVRRLEEQGVINRYVTLLQPEKIGLNVVAYAHVALEDHRPDILELFDNFVLERPEILECSATSGSYDYLLKVIAESIAAYEDFLSKHLLCLKGVRTVNTSFVLQRKKYITALPIGENSRIS